MRKWSNVEIVDVHILRNERRNADVIVHVVLGHLEQVLPCQFTQFVLLNCPVQVALLSWLVSVGLGQHLPAALMFASGVYATASCWV